MSAAADVGDDRPRLDTSLAAAAKALELPLSSEQSARLIDFVELLLRWNSTYNLTAVRDMSDMLTHHVVDCLAAVPSLRHRWASLAAMNILDVGSGGGLPGVVFAVMQPEAAITCIDSVGKKAAFLRQVAATLELSNLDVRHGRVEAMTGSRFDLITSRAFASLADFIGLTSSLLGASGAWMAMKGKIPQEEIHALPPSIEMFHVEPLFVPGLRGERCLVWMRKKGA